MLHSKENCPDIRNSKIADLYYELKEFGLKVDVYDYEADAKVKKEYGIHVKDELKDKYDGVLLAVAHSKFKNLNLIYLKKTQKYCIRP